MKIDNFVRRAAGRLAISPLLIAMVLVVSTSSFLARGMTIAGAAADIGYRDFSFGFTQAPYGDPNNSPTGEKPQSKLWFNDGSWWGILYNPSAGSAGEYHIYHFSTTGQTWGDTGTFVDARRYSHADTLWDGRHLYVASALQPGKSGTDTRARVLSFSYDPSAHTYTLDAGFPVVVVGTPVEAIVIDKDTNGLLWVTFTNDNGMGGRNVYVTHTVGNDTVWVTSYVLPASGATNLSADDLSAVVAYSGRVGVMWSNQADGALYFASHADGTADDLWQQNPALQGPQYADDHINLKSLQADAAGRVFAAVKTSLDDGSNPDPNAPLILLLILDEQGSWQRRTFGTVANHHTRPIVLIDDEHRNVYMFAASNTGNPPSAIYYKQSSLDNITFPAGLGTSFMQSSIDTNITNATSTRKSVNSQSSLLVLASDLTTGNYWHNIINLSNPTPTPTPTATPTPSYTSLVLADSPISDWAI